MTTLYDPRLDKLMWFQSPGEFASWYDRHECGGHYKSKNRDSRWYGGRTERQTRDMMFSGSREHLPAVENLIEKMREHGILSEGMKLYQPSVVGAFPGVPAAVMGLPESMYSLQDTEFLSTTVPIKIIVSLSVSVGISAEFITARGTAILALVMALMQERTVDLYVNCIGAPNMHRKRAFGTVIRIETTPLDLERATHMLCDASYIRGPMIGATATVAGEKYKGILYWPWNQHNSVASIKSLRSMMQLAPHDLLLSGTHIKQSGYVRDPIGWIKRTMADIREGKTVSD